jgi:hypothetical protein
VKTGVNAYYTNTYAGDKSIATAVVLMSYGKFRENGGRMPFPKR